MIKVLLVDDSPLMRRLLTAIFTQAGDFVVDIARNGEEALTKLDPFDPDVITLDVHMPGMSGLTCLDRIMLERPTPVVMVSTLTEEGADETLEALALGAIDFIPKPRGALSLEIEDIAPELVAKVRSAASARIAPSQRLAERVRQRATTPPARFPMSPLSRPRSTRARLDEGALAGVEAVLVGISTGGPPALDRLLAPLPANFPWPIVIAQHMPASFTGALARRLDRACAVHVVEVMQPVRLEPGTIYIGRGESDLIFSRRRGLAHVMAVPSEAGRIWHPSVDRMVESARTIFSAEALIGILMTGMGYDGAKAMATLRRDGGRVIAQDEASSVVWGMPGTLAAADGADMILSLDAIAPQLVQWSRP